MRKLFLLLISIPVLLAGCEPLEKPKGDAEVTQNAAPSVAPTPSVVATDQDPSIGFPQPGQQPPAPQADPGPYKDNGSAVLEVYWISERDDRGSIVYKIDGVQQPNFTCMLHPRKSKADGKYYGHCRRDLTGLRSGAIVSFKFSPNIPGMWHMNVLYHEGLIVDHCATSAKNSCEVSGVLY